jgi:apolipoprotein N-acyltransferase
VQPIALATISTLLLSFSGRPWGSPYIALVAIVPAFFVLSKEKSIWRSAIVSYILALPVFIVGFEGLVVKAPLAFYIVVFALSLCFALPGAFAVWVRRKFSNQLSMWVFVVSWVAVETLSGSITLWHNWANPLSIGLSQIGSPLAQLAFWAGVPLVAFYVLAFNLSLVLLLKGNWKPFSVVIFSALVLVLAPNFLQPGSSENTLKLGIVQGQVTNTEMVAASFSFSEQENLVGRYVELTEQLREKHPDVDLVIWPEAAIGWYTNYLSNFSNSRLLFPKDLTVLAGGYQSSSNGLNNSILLWDGADYTFAYTKKLLVPVYEDFLEAGQGYTNNLVNLDDTKIGLGICWESLYAELSRQSVKQGADLLVYLSDDTFAGGSVTPWYHMRTTAIRAIESRRYAVFASQAGPSGVFTPRGEQLLATQPGEGYWTVEVPKDGQNVKTPFVRFGNWFGWACVIITVLTLLFSMLRTVSFSRAKMQVP